VVRVRVVADISYRVTQAMKRFNMNSRQAEAHIRKVDKQRREWTRFLYGVAWDDPSCYDAILNLEHLGVEGACATVVRLCELEQFQPTPASRRTLENLALQSLVVAALARDERTRDAEFRVAADDGVVTLEGVVSLNKLAESAQEVAAGVGGVKQVISHLVTPSLLV
jgi:hypothetical protein